MLDAAFFRKSTVFALLVLWAAFAFSSALAEISFAAALLFWGMWKIREKSWQVQIQKPMFLLLIAFAVWCALTFVWSEAKPQSFRGIFKVLQQAAVFVLTADTLRGRADLNKWEKTFAIFLLIVLVDAIFQGIAGKDFLRGIAAQDSGAGIRLSASFKTYGLLGCYLVLTLPVALLMGMRDLSSPHVFRRGSFFALFIIGCGVLFFTKSRGAMLAFILTMLLLVLHFRNWKLLAAGALIAAAAFFVLPKSMVIHLDADRKEQSLVERYYLWDRAVSVIKAKPLTGTGVNTYAVAHQRYDTTQNWRVKNYYAHNGYLQLAAETGLPGLFLFLAFLLSTVVFALKGLRRLKEKADGFVPLGLLASAAGFLIFALVDTVLHNEQAAMAFWYVLGLQTAYFLEYPHQKL